MTHSPRPLIVGNWKMNGLRQSVTEIEQIAMWAKGQNAADIVMCPPATLLLSCSGHPNGPRFAPGAQDCAVHEEGAFTGDLSAGMLADAGARYIIVGHSERRAGHGERDADVRAKAEAVHRAGAVAILCVGETEGERRLGLTADVLVRQTRHSLASSASTVNTVIAYEPVWAIGSGRTPSADDIAAAHSVIRRALPSAGVEWRILYGGSVKPANALDILRVPGVDGLLVGGASLLASDFIAVASAAARVSGD
jgi:triosephosphate isomerase